MVWHLAVFVEDPVALDHVVNDVGLADLFAPELLWCAQVLAVVVAQMVVAHDRHRFNPFIGANFFKQEFRKNSPRKNGDYFTRVDKEVHQDGFEFSLAGLEVIPTDEDAPLLCQLQAAGHKGVLGGAIDVGALVDIGGKIKNKSFVPYFLK